MDFADAVRKELVRRDQILRPHAGRVGQSERRALDRPADRSPDIHLHDARTRRGNPLHLLGAEHILRSEEHTSELQSLMRISYAVFCLKKKKKITRTKISTHIKYNEY